MIGSRGYVQEKTSHLTFLTGGTWGALPHPNCPLCQRLWGTGTVTPPSLQGNRAAWITHGSCLEHTVRRASPALRLLPCSAQRGGCEAKRGVSSQERRITAPTQCGKPRDLFPFCVRKSNFLLASVMFPVTQESFSHTFLRR